MVSLPTKMPLILLWRLARSITERPSRSLRSLSLSIQAQRESKSSAEIATAYEAGFHHDEALVNILAAHVYPRATEHIPETGTLAERLQDAGHAYATEAGNVYYAVASFPDYGRLSGNTLDQLRAGHRVAVEPDKRDPDRKSTR